MCIAIIGAMEQEVTLLAQQLGNPSPVTIAGVRFYQGELHGHAVLLTQSGIGKVAAAVATTLAIHHFGATKVINTGSAGGFNPMLQVGDLVVASELRYHDADVTAFGYERGQMAAQPAAFICDNELVAAATAASSILPELNCTTGLICSGDSFMCDPQRVAQVREWFPSMEAVEMEGAAIAQVCHQFEVPFVVIRALSDIAGSESPVSFDSFLVTAGKHSALLVMELIKRI